MAEHDPVEDALNARKARARRVEAGSAITSEALDVTNQFLSDGRPVRQFAGPSGRGLPSQASAQAHSRFGGQQGRNQRQQQLIPRPGQIPVPSVLDIPASNPPIREQVGGGTLGDRFFDLPGPVGFSRTPQGKQLLQRILSLRGLR